MASAAEYWRERDQQNAVRLYEYADRQGQMVTRWFKRATREMEEQVQAYTRRYADSNGLTMAQARESLNDPAAINKLLADYERIVNLYPDDPVARRLQDGLYLSRSINREQFLQAQLNLIVTEVFGKYEQATAQTLTTLFEESYYKSLFDYQQYVGFGRSFNRLSTNFLAAVTSTSWSGKNYSERIWGGHRTSLARYMNRIVTTGFIEGKHNRLMVAELQKAMDMSAYNARRLIRTDGSYVANRGNLYSYIQNGTEGYRFLATLDFKTSDVCRGLDGQRFLVKDAQVGINFAPMHPFCRSTSIPDVLDEDEGDTRAARNAAGETYRVPADMSYHEWYDKHVAPFKAEQLAEQKYKHGAADAKQWSRYQQTLGKDAPSSLDKFQDLKYTDSDRYADLKRDFRHTNYYNTHLTHDEQAAVSSYVSGGSFDLNARLREGFKLEAHQMELIKQLDNALEKFPAFEGQVVRSMVMDRDSVFEFVKQLQGQDDIVFPAYTSASTQIGYHDDPSVLMYIQSKTGRDVRVVNKAENEIIFRRGTKFRVINGTLENGVVILEMEEME